MKTEEEIKEKLEELKNPDISWTIAGITTAIPSSQNMIDSLEWVLK